LGCKRKKDIGAIASVDSIARMTFETSSPRDAIALGSSLNPSKFMELNLGKYSFHLDPILGEEKKSFDTSIPRKRLYIPPPLSEIRHAAPPNQTSTVTRIHRPNQRIRATAGREHTGVRALAPGRSSFSCLSLFLTLYKTITG